MTSSTASRNPCHERRGGRAARQELLQLLTLNPASSSDRPGGGQSDPPPSCFRHRFRASPQNAASLESEKGSTASVPSKAPRNHERHTVLRADNGVAAQSSTEHSTSPDTRTGVATPRPSGSAHQKIPLASWLEWPDGDVQPRVWTSQVEGAAQTSLSAWDPVGSVGDIRCERTHKGSIDANAGLQVPCNPASSLERATGIEPATSSLGSWILPLNDAPISRLGLYAVARGFPVSKRKPGIEQGVRPAEVLQALLAGAYSPARRRRSPPPPRSAPWRAGTGRARSTRRSNVLPAAGGDPIRLGRLGSAGAFRRASTASSSRAACACGRATPSGTTAGARATRNGGNPTHRGKEKGVPLLTGFRPSEPGPRARGPWAGFDLAVPGAGTAWASSVSTSGPAWSGDARRSTAPELPSESVCLRSKEHIYEARCERGRKGRIDKPRAWRCAATPRRRWSGRLESNRRRPAWELFLTGVSRNVSPHQNPSLPHAVASTRSHVPHHSFSRALGSIRGSKTGYRVMAATVFIAP